MSAQKNRLDIEREWQRVVGSTHRESTRQRDVIHPVRPPERSWCCDLDSLLDSSRPACSLQERSLMHPLSLAMTLSASALLLACSSEVDTDIAGTQNSHLSDTPASAEPGIDCSASCPEKGLSSVIDGDYSSDRFGQVAIEQYPDCSTMHPSTDSTGKFHRTAPAQPCTMSGPDDEPHGALACETFSCGNTGHFTASACIGGKAGADWTGHCATEKEACALAYEANEHALDDAVTRVRLCK